MRELHYELNPTLTFAAKNNLDILFEDLEKQEMPNPELAEYILKSCYRREMARKVGEAAVKVFNGDTEDFLSIEVPIRDYKDTGVLEGNSQAAVSEELSDLLLNNKANTKWKFNISTLVNKVEGVGPSSFTIIAARPEAGKTALWISFSASPGGFCFQGAKVLAFCNEELASKNQLRAYSSASGLDYEDVVLHPDRAIEAYKPIKGLLVLYDVVGMSLEEMDLIIEREKPDIVVIDQLDKVKIDGEFARGDERLRAVYTNSRELAKRRNVALIAISQLSADAQDKSVTDFSMLENSRTGKAAEADLIFCLGYNPQLGNLRQINIPKNKISGVHTPVSVTINPSITRYTE